MDSNPGLSTPFSGYIRHYRKITYQKSYFLLHCNVALHIFYIVYIILPLIQRAKKYSGIVQSS